MMANTVVHEAVKPLSWLIGKWISVSAKGKYPTIEPFEYYEELEFMSVGQPALNYSSKTWNVEKNKQMHLESGFLRIKPGTKQVAFMVAHNFGLTSLEEGNVDDGELKLKSTQITRMSFAQDPAVKAIERYFKFQDNKLECTVYLETSNTPLTEHLRIVYEKRTT